MMFVGFVSTLLRLRLSAVNTSGMSIPFLKGVLNAQCSNFSHLASAELQRGRIEPGIRNDDARIVCERSFGLKDDPELRELLRSCAALADARRAARNPTGHDRENSLLMGKPCDHCTCRNA